MWKNKKVQYGLVVSVIIVLLVGVIIWRTNQSTEDIKQGFPWNGCYRIIREDGSDLQLSFDKDKKQLKASSMAGGYANDVIDEWVYDGEKISIAITRKAYNEIFELKEDTDTSLTGTSLYMAEESPVVFEKYRDEPKDEEQNNQDLKRSAEEQITIIRQNTDFAPDDISYEYTYDLNQKDKYADFIKKYKLDEITEGKKDLELMKVLMNWLCDTCTHGSSAYYDSESIDEMVEYGKENHLNCRCLSIVLSEVMRMYGIQAKVIWCYPKDDYFDDCHVVVQAYSEEKKQWIMLDPTYRLVLQKKDGTYMDIRQLREWIADNGDEIITMTPDNPNYLVANEDAGYTGEKDSTFNLVDYACYMAKNLCRMKCLSQNSTNGSKCFKDNYTIELFSTQYNKAGISNFDQVDSSKRYELYLSEKYVYTTDIDHFFELPE